MTEKERDYQQQYKNGFVFSGGAYRGVGQIGALKALLERDIKPDVISGTSAGAMNAALYASGRSPDEMFEIWKKEPLGKTIDFQIPKFGIVAPNKVGELLKPYLSAEHLEDLSLPVFIATTCINNGEQVIFQKGNLVRLLNAACSVPVFYEPVEIEGRQYVDGGLVSNLPVEPLVGKCERIIGISVNPIPEKERLEGLKEIIYRTIWIGIEGSVKKTKDLCDWYIAPEELGKHSLIDRSAQDVFFKAGYEYTCRFLDEQESR